jgi:hypothetical protein
MSRVNRRKIQSCGISHVFVIIKDLCCWFSGGSDWIIRSEFFRTNGFPGRTAIEEILVYAEVGADTSTSDLDTGVGNMSH